MGMGDLINLGIAKIMTLPFVFICLTVHEFSHGFVAYKLGDNTAKDAGRLTLNPFAHIDWLGVIAMVFLGFGWAKPVPVNPYRFKKSGARGIVWVSLAGPVSNLAFAFLLVMLWQIMAIFAPEICHSFYFRTIVTAVVSLNIGLAVFNLIPIPPLDGSKVLEYFLPYNASRWMENNTNILYTLLLVASFTGMLGRIITPVADLIISGMSWLAYTIMMLFV